MHFSELNYSFYIKRYPAVLYYDVFSLKDLRKTKVPEIISLSYLILY